MSQPPSHSQSQFCPQLRSRVVVVKYERKPLSNRTLFGFCEQFGYLREHLVLKNKVGLRCAFASVPP